MLRESGEKQLSLYSGLYKKIPENHLLKRIDKAVDFSFINELLEGKTGDGSVSLLAFSKTENRPLSYFMSAMHRLFERGFL